MRILEQFTPAAGNILDGQCTYNVTLRHVCATTVTVEKELSITYSEHVFVALGIQHAVRVSRVILSFAV
jgi:hypothetical protein